MHKCVIRNLINGPVMGIVFSSYRPVGALDVWVLVFKTPSFRNVGEERRWLFLLHRILKRERAGQGKRTSYLLPPAPSSPAFKYRFRERERGRRVCTCVFVSSLHSVCKYFAAVLASTWYTPSFSLSLPRARTTSRPPLTLVCENRSRFPFGPPFFPTRGRVGPPIYFRGKGKSKFWREWGEIIFS